MLTEIMKQYGLSLKKVAEITGFDKSTISLVKNNKYKGSPEVPQQILKKLEEAGYKPQFRKITVKPYVFITTENVRKFDALCDELLDPSTDLTSSIGVVIGRAGRGKTVAARHYAVMHREAAYVLYVDGFSLVDVAREIAFELGGIRPRTFRSCLNVIEDALTASAKRRLVIIDEADKMPKKYLEMLRGINERAALPIVLVGEEPLRRALEQERRLKSRTRSIVVFDPISVPDVYAYYKMALGLDLDPEVAEALWQRSKGDFRLVVRDAIAVARIMNTNRLVAVTMDVVRALP